MSKVMIISPKNKTLYNFRGDLIKDIISHGHQVVAVGPNKDNIDEVLKLGVSFRENKLKKDKVSIVSDFGYYKGLKRIIKEEKPDLVFSYTIKPVVYGSIAAKKAGVKRIYAMVTGLGRIYASNTIKAKMLRMATSVLYRKAFRCCNKVIFQNNDDINNLVRSKVLKKEKTIRVDGSGVNMKKFAYTRVPLNDRFLMVSRIIREKGVLDYFKAAEIVKERYPNSKFILLGGYDSSIGAIKEEDIRHYLDEKIVEIPGEVSDVRDYYKKSMCFVLPSYYREGLPRTILEALSIGRPVITTDWTGCRDAIEDGENGFLVPIKDYERLAEKMIWMVEHHKSVDAISRANRKKCEKVYDVNIVNEKMLNIMGL